MIIRPKHISVRNPQAPGPRSRLGSALCSRRRRYDARRSPIFAGHLRSGVLCINAGKLEVGSHSWRSLFAPACRATDFHFENRVLVYTFLFRPRLGVSGDHRSRLVPLEPNSVRTCPRRTRPAPFSSAQFRPSVKKRPQLGWELRDHWQARRQSRRQCQRSSTENSWDIKLRF